MKHVRCQRANIEPVFFAYPDNAEIDALVEGVVKGAAPDYDFTAETVSATGCGSSATGR